MKLTRHQADLVLRHYTAEYAERASEDFTDAPEFASFVRELQCRIDADLSRSHVGWVVRAWQKFAPGQPDLYGDINFEVNEALDSAGFRPPHIRRYSEQETTA